MPDGLFTGIREYQYTTVSSLSQAFIIRMIQANPCELPGEQALCAHG
jgi:hypothetical protein